MAGQRMAGRNMFARWTLSSVIDSLEAKVFINRTVGELLFEGYEDPLLSLADWVGDEIGTVMPTDRFGWFYKVN